MRRAAALFVLLALACGPPAPRPQIEVLESEADVRELNPADPGWRTPDTDVPHFALGRTNAWVRLPVRNLTGHSQSFVLEVGAPWLDRIDFYVFRGTFEDGASAGDTLDFRSRPVVHRNPAYPVKLETDEHVWIYVRAESKGVLSIPMRLWYAEDFDKKAQGEYLIHGLYFGTLTALLLYNFIILVFVRERSYLFYCIYLFAVQFYYILQNGFGSQFFFHHAPYLLNQGLMATAAVTGFGLTLFTHSFLEVRKAGRWLDLLLKGQMAVFGAAFFVSLAAPYEFAVRGMNVILPGSSVLMLVTSIVCASKGIKQSRYFILAWVTVLAAIVLESLTSMGLLNLTWVGRFGTQIGTVVEVVLFSVALGRRIRTLSDENAATQSRLAAIEKDLEMARAIQERILPVEPPQTIGARIETLYMPLKGVGGDFYDFHRGDSMHFGVLIADVTGHGMAAALDSSTVKIAFRNERQEISSPARLLSNMNQFLKPLIDYRFISAQYAFFDLAEMKLFLGSAGHPPLILLRQGEAHFFAADGLLLGVDAEASFAVQEIQLQNDDRIVLYTDGLSETEGGFDSDREALEDLVLAGRNLNPGRFLDEAVSWLQQRSAPVADDVTVVVIDIRPVSA